MNDIRQMNTKYCWYTKTHKRNPQIGQLLTLFIICFCVNNALAVRDSWEMDRYMKHTVSSIFFMFHAYKSILSIILISIKNSTVNEQLDCRVSDHRSGSGGDVEGHAGEDGNLDRNDAIGSESSVDGGSEKRRQNLVKNTEDVGQETGLHQPE